MNEGMKNYGNVGFDGVTHTWDIVQKEIKCCGVKVLFFSLSLGFS